MEPQDSQFTTYPPCVANARTRVFPPLTWLPIVSITVLFEPGSLLSVRVNATRTALLEEKPGCLLAQALLCLMADAVCLLLSLHCLMFGLLACHWLLASVVKHAVDERKHLDYLQVHREYEMNSLGRGKQDHRTVCMDTWFIGRLIDRGINLYVHTV